MMAPRDPAPRANRHADLEMFQPVGPDRTVEQQVVRELRNSILNGSLAPGVRVPYRRLAQQFRVSVTPVRVALLELATERLVEINTHGGARIAPLSADELEEVFATRIGIDSWLARLGVQQLTDEDLTQIEAYFLEAREAAVADDAGAYLDLAWDCRRECYRAANRPRLLERSISLFRRSARYNRFTLGSDLRIAESFKDLEDLLSACRTGNGDLARQSTVAALEHTFAYLAEHFSEVEEPGANWESEPEPR